jgi:predicted  nucleic acid-binding Zn-ribbon protein
MEQIEKMQKQLDQLAKKKPRSRKKLKKIKYVGVEFEPTKINNCEKEVNDALSQGYEPIRDVDTPRGLVLVLGLWQ